MSAPTLKIHCPSWGHLENFYAQKVKEGNVLLARVPFSPVVDSAITVALELPDGLRISIAGRVEAVRQAPDGRKSAIRMVLHGLDGTMRARLEQAVIDGRGDIETPLPAAQPKEGQARTESGLPMPIPADVPIDEEVPLVLLPAVEEVPEASREQYRILDETLRSLREQAAHEVLGVEWDADVATIRLGYFKLIKRYHPDVVARHDSPEISMLASELFIYINKAYDRLRDSAVAAGKAIAAGPALLPHDGWIADFEDLGPLAGDSVQKQLRWVEQEPRSAASSNDQPKSDGASPTIERAAPLVADLERAAPVPTQALIASGLFVDARKTATGAKPLLQDVTAAAASGEEEDDDEFDVEALLEQGKALLDNKEYDTARKHFASFLERKPRNRTARALYHVSYGHTLLARDKLAEAQTQFEVALKHDPGCSHAKGARSSAPNRRKRRPSLLERILRR